MLRSLVGSEMCIRDSLNATREQWRESRQGIPVASLMTGIVSPELAGLIEPAVIAVRQPVENLSLIHI